MRFRVWGVSVLTAVVAVTSLVVTPLPAHADGLRSTSTQLTCEQYVGVGDFNRCTVTVIDTDPYGAAGSPTGGANVTMDDQLAEWGCTFDGSPSCTMLIPFRDGAPLGVKNVSATYFGDPSHAGSVSPTLQTTLVPGEASMNVLCSPAVAAVGQDVYCSAGVMNYPSGGHPPDGETISFWTDRPGLPAPTCTMQSGGCGFWFTATRNVLGVTNVAAHYSGDGWFGYGYWSVPVSVKIPTAVKAKPAIANLVSPTKLFLTLSATLTDSLAGNGLAGLPVRFRVGNTVVCTAATDATGTATCGGLTTALDAGQGYKALYDGDDTHFRASASGDGVRL